jgi:uncharacterized protein YuzB (UPF0349 family)
VFTPYSYKQKEGGSEDFSLRIEKIIFVSHGSSSLTEKLEHSTILDILQIGVYAYFGYVAYSNLGFSQGDILGISTNPTVIAVQLAGVLVTINLVFMLHDRISGSSDPLR